MPLELPKPPQTNIQNALDVLVKTAAENLEKIKRPSEVKPK